MRIASLLFIAAVVASAQDARPAAFSFRNGFWINLHLFLYHLGQQKTGAEEPDPVWAAAVRDYRATWSKKDAVFDQDLIAVTNALAKAGDAPSLPGSEIPETLRATLERVAPIYRRVWWERHSAANVARIAELEKLVAQYGRQVGDIIARAYQQQWPAGGQKVEIVAYANWAGAYSTDGGLVVISSMDEANAGSRGLEILFHEWMHQWDARLIIETLRGLSHSLIFYTAGYAVAQVVPRHRPYAENMWDRLPGKQALDAYWLPYLKGKGTLEEAIENVARAMPR